MLCTELAIDSRAVHRGSFEACQAVVCLMKTAKTAVSLNFAYLLSQTLCPKLDRKELCKIASQPCPFLLSKNVNVICNPSLHVTAAVSCTVQPGRRFAV